MLFIIERKQLRYNFYFKCRGENKGKEREKDKKRDNRKDRIFWERERGSRIEKKDNLVYFKEFGG